MELRPYQVEALDAIDNAEAEGHNRQLVVLPTGTGKTVLFSSLMANRKGRRLCLVHRDELVRQTVRKLSDAGLRAGVIKANENDVTYDVAVASVQTLSRDRRLAQYVRHGAANLIVVDEAHHAPAPSYRKVIDAVLAPGGLLVGVTATPDRKTHEETILPTGTPVVTMRAGMRKVFEHLTYYRQLTDMIAEGWLCDVIPVTTETDMDMSSVSVIADDWADGDLGEALDAADAYSDIIRNWSRYASDRPTIAFLPTVATSRTLTERLIERGIPAAHIDGTTPLEDRQVVYRNLRDGKIRVLSNCMVLTEGFDEPSVSCVIVARPTQSRALFAQMIGRGTRLFPGKSDCLVMSVTSHDLDVSPVTLQTFLNDEGMEDGISVAKRQKQILESRERVSAEAKAAALSFVNRYVARPAGQSSFIWRKLASVWTIIAGDTRVDLEPAFNDHWVPKVFGSGVVLADPLHLEGAVSVAEQYVARYGSTVLADSSAKWRGNHPKPAQVSYAVALGLDLQVAKSMTRGEVSEYITTAKLENRSTRRLSRKEKDEIESYFPG